MLIMLERWPPFAVALLLAGCASIAASDPPALAPTFSSQPAGRPAVASGDELEGRGVAANAREHERATARRPTTSAVAGAVAAVATLPKPAVFAERQASEALDRLAGLVPIRHEKRGAVITLASDALVDSGQWALTTSGQYNLRELAAGLRDQAGRMIIIQGYTDSLGSAAVNDALSLRRAEAVRDFLTTQGVVADKMRAEGLGAKRPVASNGSADGRAQNRRIEIVLVALERDSRGR
jgi:outer membrane protein OmpA-like peptidoglycan-associated protein